MKKTKRDRWWNIPNFSNLKISSILDSNEIPRDNSFDNNRLPYTPVMAATTTPSRGKYLLDNVLGLNVFKKITNLA